MPLARQRLLTYLSVALGCVGAALVSIHLSAAPTGSSLAAPPPRAPDAHPASLDLQPGQLDGLRIEPVQTHAFAVEKQAVGSISFDEDPAIVQAESTLVTAAANLELSSKELKRVRNLGESNGIAQKDIEQAIALILGTAPGERPMRPAFGCAVHDVVFDTVDALVPRTGELLREPV